MKHDYTISELTSTFGKYADEFDEKNPGTDDFNLPLALSVICHHVEKLMHQTGTKE